MKNKLEFAVKKVSVVTFLYFVVFLMMAVICHFAGWRLRAWFVQMSVIFMGVAFFIGIIMSLLKSASSIKYIFVVLFCFAAFIIGGIFLFFMRVSLGEEAVVTRDGKKYVAARTELMGVTVKYYEYKNFLVSGNVVRIKEFYDFTADEYNDNPVTTYYDEEG
ncbi:hypothetical protein SAMN02910298_01972 [Pseudobutyrivibrio sp. YE44]|uniref:hypothetical protein n=1 Tax=Pseudobutyrivibrio sp. YE44 TaxID=1520802 RepID=UPI0008843F0E|nr:hypothetical protein [Pseudobutyrivibrio sp. YE44]SDB40268.1 hypothetical protein SAMN02910298_01972 [Pseudobutyrivibrio sp. YE44]